MAVSEDQFYLCPYCSSENYLSIIFSEGEFQEFVTDCETCCRPILIKIELEGMDILSFSAEKENE